MKNKTIKVGKFWAPILLNDYFDIKAGKYYYPHEYGHGDTPYISATVANNGVSEYIDLDPDFKGNCITTEKISCQAFYQKYDFCATSDINVFIPKFENFNEYIGIFIATLINYDQNYRWNYGRQCRVGDSKKINVMMPITSNGNPNWQFMENYIKTLNYKRITTKNKYDFDKIYSKKYKKFKLKDLFSNIYKGYPHVKVGLVKKMLNSKNAIPLVTRTAENNGVDCYVSIDQAEKIESGNAITIGDTTATLFYQPKQFITGDHMVVCRADWLNQFTGIYIKTLIDLEKYRYSYGRAFKLKLIKNTEVILPVDDKGAPDWIFIESYIKSIPYGDRI
ncbi:restriction endonuclease subunit S [Miniphocaeibacter halophilus]|uniref:Restriction endonuclease subunit S n=1 Tax=Miniphocaeibacter halophilus TaxID=2931922 RepID=A0AC61MYH6_9FIRM|nr:restriction endonuclease subunit S [Miniphocaeibacter halophilus]QQK09014.1 restriction endonuclease subunit S [Miniphocaeibacter halophilus]